MSEPTHDVVIIGGGHNGLTAAAYLALAGKSVLLLEQGELVGGAAISAQAFPGVDARLSRYSYLVSLLPQRIIDELGLEIGLARRRYSSYTPDPADTRTGLLVDRGDEPATRASFDRVGAAADFSAWNAFYRDTESVARAIFPTVCEPLPTRSEARTLLGDDRLWEQFFERPLGGALRDRFQNDLVRGVVATDGLIGTFTSLDSPELNANRCFLYHVIGNGTGDWDVPVGGMGAVSGELEKAARQAGARIVTEAEVTGVTPEGEVSYRHRGVLRVVQGAHVLANVAPWVLRGLLGEAAPASVRLDVEPGAGPGAGWSAGPDAKPEGAQVKVNLLLRRLPLLRDEAVSPEAAFGGTFHINETLTQLESAYDQADHDGFPELLPCEIYCHSLSDPSILSPELVAAGAQTLTVFALHAPHRWLTEENNDVSRDRLQAAVLASLNSVLAEPIEDLLLTDADGRPCIETKTTLDLEHALNLPGGNIFHGPLEWPFLEDDAPRSTAAERWGVATEHPRILICGAGARRGGGVSGIGGHNAAMAVLEG
ncbi:NAD(P)/FAD-dependent oxidoreductase [Cryobacterium sp. TMT2-18-3]|uniref:phytoene desaturase family protein n=1 Tax=unclassified Cryobacterium TaxID=2649013 RepID=UPI00106BB3B8|nr:MULTISPECIES: FAD-dependent oxidoreductase [unclassified Cryobacterium]TFC29663.1 NAD(P)/FAD-dependent oxidoreductase [Cryobacterium sp. TMT2-18-2]TFC65777.1 NAD(P)/FAD-dependent oxidoreductase [Cryobacterium sp. TMT2-18-3]